MKVVLSFIAGIVVCTVLFYTVNLILPVRAMTESVDPTNPSSDNTGLSGLVPNIEKIYTDALQMPFQKAESKITDPDIAAFYRELMDETGLAPSKTPPTRNKKAEAFKASADRTTQNEPDSLGIEPLSSLASAQRRIGPLFNTEPGAFSTGPTQGRASQVHLPDSE